MSDLRDRIDELLDRVQAGETVRIERDGVPVAELRPARPDHSRPMQEILEEARSLEPVDLESFRADLDAIFDSNR